MTGAAATLFFLAISTSAAFAWGADGHAIVGEVAQRRLTPAATARVGELLRSEGSLASIGNWADDERSRDRTTSRWHFVDIPLSATSYDAGRDCALVEGAGDCLIAALDRELEVVARPALPLEKRQGELKFIVHFVGDLHQPFHTLLEKRGGNDEQVTIVTRAGVNGNAPFNTNLHAAWDAALIEKTTWS